jgi:hypothetical protein
MVVPHEWRLGMLWNQGEVEGALQYVTECLSSSQKIDAVEYENLKPNQAALMQHVTLKHSISER